MYSDIYTLSQTYQLLSGFLKTKTRASEELTKCTLRLPYPFVPPARADRGIQIHPLYRHLYHDGWQGEGVYCSRPNKYEYVHRFHHPRHWYLSQRYNIVRADRIDAKLVNGHGNWEKMRYILSAIATISSRL